MGMTKPAVIRRYILEKIATERPALKDTITRVSKQALDRYESKLRLMILEDIRRHPSVGHTFNP